jgi:uncharacterized protein DUF4917
VTSSAIDGSLMRWEEVAGAEKWQALLLGNGLSINVWPNFGYGSLFDHAQDGNLTDEDRALFEGTTNFERVLADLNIAIRTCDLVGVDTAPLYARYHSIQLALGHAIREVHLKRSQVPDTTLEAIRGVLERFEWVFTTSYDLLVYWAMGYPKNDYTPFVDCFRWGGRCEFDPRRADIYVGQIPIYFLHGALHLVVGGSGITSKLKSTSIRTILDQFGQPLQGDPQARSLLVTEGSSQDKLRIIEGNDYLTHALQRLRECELPIVVFGSSLSEQDRHLADALNEHPERPVAVSLRPGPKRDLAVRQADIYGRLEAEKLMFFDATTHPLGMAGIVAPSG